MTEGCLLLSAPLTLESSAVQMLLPGWLLWDHACLTKKLPPSAHLQSCFSALQLLTRFRALGNATAEEGQHPRCPARFKGDSRAETKLGLDIKNGTLTRSKIVILKVTATLLLPQFPTICALVAWRPGHNVRFFSM